MSHHRVVVERLPEAVMRGLEEQAVRGVSANDAALAVLAAHYRTSAPQGMRPPKQRAQPKRLILRVPEHIWLLLDADANSGTISGVARRILTDHYERNAP